MPVLPSLQLRQRPQAMLNGTLTMSPTCRNSTSLPFSMISPVISWPSTRPSGAVVRPRTMCWSLPQMFVATVRRMTPCGVLRPTLAGLTPGPSLSSKPGYSRSLTSTFPGPMYMTALLPATEDPFRRRRHASVPAAVPTAQGPGERSSLSVTVLRGSEAAGSSVWSAPPPVRLAGTRHRDPTHGLWTRSVACRARPAATVVDQGPRWGRRPAGPRRTVLARADRGPRRPGRHAGRPGRGPGGRADGAGPVGAAGRRDRPQRRAALRPDGLRARALHRRPLRRPRRAVDDPRPARPGRPAPGRRVGAVRGGPRDRPHPRLPALGRLRAARPADAARPLAAVAGPGPRRRRRAGSRPAQRRL